MTAFGKRLIQSAQEAGAIARGEADPVRTTRTPRPTSTCGRSATARSSHRPRSSRATGSPSGPCGTLNRVGRGPDASTRAYLLAISREPAAVRRVLEATGIEPLRHGRPEIQLAEPQVLGGNYSRSAAA